jgi:hypothetical protein
MYFTNILNLQNFDLSIFKKNILIYLYIYNVNYYCFFKINKEVKIKIKNKQVIEIYNQKQKNLNSINTFIRQFALCDSSKIKFTGKGYKIKKNSKESLILLFNRSHTTTMWWKNLFIKKLKKYKIFIKYTPINKKIIETILNIRPVNIFTKKGLRKARQLLYKKKGKK